MKHGLRVTIILVIIFFLAQLTGLAILTQYVDFKTTSETKTTVLINESYNLTGLTPPSVKNESYSFLHIIIAVIMGTALVLLIIKYKKRNLWNIWFFFSVILTLLMAFAPFFMKLVKLILPSLQGGVILFTLVITTLLAYYKVYKKNLYVHNFTELFIYGGLASMLVPILNLISGIVLLLLISVYDMYAVWKSKHMINMAEFQTDAKVFAGLLIPYKKTELAKQEKTGQEKITHLKIKEKAAKQATSANAILGGGDIAFPLLFSGAVMKYTGTFFVPFIISICAAIALFCLYLFGKKGRYYPAMPFISIGCFIGFAIGWLVM